MRIRPDTSAAVFPRAEVALLVFSRRDANVITEVVELLLGDGGSGEIAALDEAHGHACVAIEANACARLWRWRVRAVRASGDDDNDDALDASARAAMIVAALCAEVS